MCVRMNKDVIHTYFCYFKSKRIEKGKCKLASIILNISYHLLCFRRKRQRIKLNE